MSLFSIELELTRHGLAHVDDVLDTIFSYLSLLRACVSLFSADASSAPVDQHPLLGRGWPPGTGLFARPRFDEIQKLCEHDFNYRDQVPYPHILILFMADIEIEPENILWANAHKIFEYFDWQ